VGAQAGHDAVHVLIEHACRVADGLPDAELHVLLGERSGGPPEPGYTHLKGDARAMGGLLKQHGDVPAFQGVACPAAGLDRMGEVDHLAQLGGVQVGDVDEVTAVEIHRGDHDPSDTGREAKVEVRSARRRRPV
jgi:hypothetical protein